MKKSIGQWVIDISSCLALVVLVIAWGVIISRLTAPEYIVPEREEPFRAPTTYQVMPGDTIWDIARKYYPDRNPKDIEYMIGDLNGLKNSTIYEYQVLKLPEL